MGLKDHELQACGNAKFIPPISLKTRRVHAKVLLFSLASGQTVVIFAKVRYIHAPKYIRARISIKPSRSRYLVLIHQNLKLQHPLSFYLFLLSLYQRLGLDRT